MVYQGSKSKYVGDIVPILQRIIDKEHIKCYLEPFVGGANIIDKIDCKRKVGLDKCYSLIKLHQQGQTALELIPAHGNPEWWYEAKDIYRRHLGAPSMEKEMEGWRIGAIQFFGSFNRGGFSRGYAKDTEKKDYYYDAYKNFMEQIKNPKYKDIKFEWCNYINLKWPEEIRTLIYCDPPYQGIKPYGYKFETDFDYDKYWNWVRKMSKHHIVICSEQTFPNDFEIIWEKEVRRTMDKTNNFKAVERLGRYKLEN